MNRPQRMAVMLLSMLAGCGDDEGVGPSFSSDPGTALAIVYPSDAIDPWLLSDEQIEVEVAAESAPSCSWTAPTGDAGTFPELSESEGTYTGALTINDLPEAVRTAAEEQVTLAVTCAADGGSNKVDVRLRAAAH